MKTIIITGVTSGIGKATMKALISRGFSVIGTGRSQEKIRDLMDELRTLDYSGSWNIIQADLSSQREIKEAVRKIRDLGMEEVYCLINNAGSFASSYTETVDGLEWQFAVNHMAPFLMVNLLLPLMTEGSRIITVGSSSHFRAPLHWKDPQMKSFYSSLGAYRQSKFFNVLMTNEWNRRYAEKGIRAYIADPGLVNTEIGLKGTRGLSRLVWSIRRRKGQSPEEGAASSVYLASEPYIEPSQGIYFKYCRPLAPDKRTANTDLMKRLWTLSETCIV